MVWVCVIGNGLRRTAFMEYKRTICSRLARTLGQSMLCSSGATAEEQDEFHISVLIKRRPTRHQHTVVYNN